MQTQALSPELDMFLQRMPKVELHLHLEGSVQPRTLLELAHKNNVELPARDVAGVAQLFRFTDFLEFLTVYMALVRAVQHGEDFERLAYELGCDLAAQQVLYAEIMLSPMQHMLRGVDLVETIEGTAAGFARASREFGLEVGLCFDYGRQYGPDKAWSVLEAATRGKPYGMVGWSIGGNEIGHPPEPFAEVFAAARQAGLHVMAHAGEVVGPASVWGAVDALECARIGHGIHSVHDPQLIYHLRQRGVVLDISPSSNILTGAAASLAEHPLRTLYDQGVTITLNTDDPTFFRTTLTDEYRRVVQQFGFTVDDICVLLNNAVFASFLPRARQQALWQRMDEQIRGLRSDLGL